ncbi:MAG: hypothetical protein QOH97_1251 [Actinoplanes sp.]|jgi:hypothetical protein|nr:hypothetical protein [Actinoplanes sp.]
MCGVNHNLFPRPGYLIDISCESIAAKVLFTRMLSHHADIGLTAEQITSSGGSLRVGLAALRAAARPIAPWYDQPFISFGENVELLDRVGEILTGLPGWVRDLLGPQLTTPLPSP